MNKLTVTLFLAFLLIPSLSACNSGTEKDKVESADKADWVTLDKGTVAKDFTLLDLKGKKVALSDFKGKTVFLNFWATWCAPCRHEMPSMEALSKRYDKKDLIILAVATDHQGKEIVQPFVDKNGYTFLVLIDSTNKVSDSYGVFALPTTFIIDRDGKIIEMVPGMRDWTDKDILESLDEIIGKADKA